MSHLHSVIDEDVAFVIDPATRIVSPRSTDCLKLVQGDHNSEVYTFHLPRYIEGHDMSSCNRVEVHFINLGNGQQNPGVFRVSDFGLNEDETEVYARWVISREATKYAGSLCFIVSFKCIPDDVVEYAWNTEKYKGVTVGEGIDNGEEILEEYSDVLAEWEQRVFENALPTDGTPGQVLTKTENGTEWKDAPGGADWNAAEGEPGHVLNRPFYSEVTVDTVLAETSPAFIEYAGQFILTDPILVITGEEYTVNWNGTEYTCVCGEFDVEGVMTPVLGNLSAIGIGDDTGEPFLIMIAPDEFAAEAGFTAAIQPLDGSTELTISIAGTVEIVHKLPQKYIHQPDYNAPSYKEGHILNRTHYKEDEEIILDEDVPFVDGVAVLEKRPDIYAGAEYIASVEFGELVVSMSGVGEPYVEGGVEIGVKCILSYDIYTMAILSVHPEYVDTVGGEGLLMFQDVNATMRVTIKKPEILKKLDPVFLPPTPIPFFDLVEFGLDALDATIEDDTVQIVSDVGHALSQAMENGPVRLRFNVNNGSSVSNENIIIFGSRDDLSEGESVGGAYDAWHLRTYTSAGSEAVKTECFRINVHGNTVVINRFTY